MAKKTAKLEGVHVQRCHRQHSSVVVVIPKLVREALELAAGDYLVFASHPSTNVVELSKFVPGGMQNGRDKGDSG